MILFEQNEGGFVMLKAICFFVSFSWKHEKRYILYQVINQFVSSLVPLVAVVLPRYIINELLGAQRIWYLVLCTGIMAGYIFAANAVSSWLRRTGFTHRIRVSHAFLESLHIQSIRADYVDIESSHYLEMKEKAEKFLFGNWKGFSYVLDTTIDIIGKLFTLVGVIAIVALLNPLLVLLFTGLVFISSYMEARVQRKQADMRIQLTVLERKTRYYGEVLEDYTYGKEIRLYGMGDWLLKREREHHSHSYRLYRESNRLGIRSDVFHSLTTWIQQIAAYAYLIHQVMATHIGIGDFFMYIGGVTAFAVAMRGLMQDVVDVAAYRKYYDAIEEYLHIPARMRDNKGLSIPDGDHVIEFRNVSFSYPNQTGYALRHINLSLKAGHKLSVVGENGAGKTTFVKLLCRIYDPTEGVILLDGTDIRELDYDAYCSLFSTVFQDFKLYALSLKDNVALSQSDTVSDRDVEIALRKAGFGERLATLPKGVQTHVHRNYDGDGFEPSGGEGQKIALARALFKDAPFVIMDEPTAALDPRAEYEMYQHFHDLTSEKAAVFISHRLSSARFCDAIALFREGSITEYGTHEKLLKEKGQYAELFRMQAQYYTENAPG